MPPTVRKIQAPIPDGIRRLQKSFQRPGNCEQLIELKNIEKSYALPAGRQWVLRNVNPVIGEGAFRSCAFWFLVRLVIWQFWPAVRVPALFFAVGHRYRAQDPAGTADIFAITALGDGLANLARVLTIGLSNMPAVCRDGLPGFGHRA